MDKNAYVTIDEMNFVIDPKCKYGYLIILSKSTKKHG
jgi:hypothetical protein